LRRKNPREICLDILNQVEETDNHLDGLLTHAFKTYRHLTALDRAFLTELIYGVLRWRGRLDWTAEQFSHIPFEKIELKILNILRLGLYQILFLSKIPVSASVNESVKLAKRIRSKGGASFVNAVLRSVLRGKEELVYPDVEKDPSLYFSVVQSHPLWLIQRWIREMGVERTMEICLFNNEISPLTLRTNTLRMKREDLIEKLKEKGLTPSPTVYSEEGIVLKEPPPISELPFHQEGFYVIQEEASQLVTSILDPRPEEINLDACAAPGGKTTHMAQRMGNRGRIYALDLSKEKLNSIEKRCHQLGVKMVKTIKGDATQPPPLVKQMKFDRVLADVPCSGFGTLRRNPDLKWKRKEEDIQRLSTLQSRILRGLAPLVKEGGVLVYSTCTVFIEENEKVVEEFLKENPQFQLDPITKVLPDKCHPFIQNGYLKTFPPKDRMDGFFVARMMKT